MKKIHLFVIPMLLAFLFGFVPSVKADNPAKITINASGDSNVSNFVLIGNTLYFSATNGSNGLELWKSDGTQSGTSMVKDIRSGSNSSSPSQMINFNGTLFFYADDGTNGAELWKSDGTSNGTVLVKDIRSGSFASNVGNMTIMNNELYFSAYSGSWGIWKTDGTSNGTVSVQSLSNNVNEMLGVGTTLYYVVGSAGSDVELYKTNGSSNGGSLVKDILSGYSSTPRYLTAISSTIYFRAASAQFTGDVELWKSDGTSNGTVLVKDIFPGSSSSITANSNPFTVFNNKLYFVATSTSSNNEIWMSDGTSDGTVLLKEINPSQSSNPTKPFTYNSTLYFQAQTNSSDASTYYIWQSDGTTNGTTALINMQGYDFATAGSYLFFNGYNSSTGNELWKSDGTLAGTILTQDIWSGSSSLTPSLLTGTSTHLFFKGYNQSFGNTSLFVYTLDADPPSISLNSLADPNSDTTPTLSGTATDASSTVSSVQFQMDGTGGSWSSCTADDGTFDEASEPFTCTSTSLSDGSHTMYVRSTDSLSNMSSNSTDTFTIDTGGPSVSLTALTPDPTTDTTPTLSGTATDSYSVLSTVEYQVDGTSGSWTACTASDGAFDETSEAFSCTTSTLSQGSHTIYVRATDALSNTTSSGSYDSDVFTIDLDGPSLTLTAVSPDPTLNTKPVLTGTAVDGGLPIDYVQFQMDSTSGTWTDCTASDGAFDELSETFTCTIISALSEAEHVMYVRSADSSANSSQTSDTFTVDRTPSYINADFPGEGAYIRQQRPTFKFRASSGSISQFNGYTMSAQHEDGTGFTISHIPVNAPSTTGTGYTITSSGFGDSNEDNDYVYITTTSSPDWDSNSNDGRLKEGKNSWTMTAHESNGNTVSVGHSFYVDVTKPQITAITTSTLGLFEGYLLSTQTKPKVSFTLSDNLIPYKYTVDVYRQNYILGIETGRTLVSSESIMPVLGSDQLAINLDFAPQQSLPYGKYLFILTGYDKAENTSDIATLSLQLLSQEKAEELLKKPVKKDTKTFSLPELEKKAILRRQKEAQALEKLVQDIKETTANVDERVVRTASYVYQPLQKLATSTQKVLGVLVDSLDESLTALVQYVQLPALDLAMSPSLEERIIAVRKGEHEDVVHGAPKMGLSTEKVEEQFKQHHAPTNQKIQEIFAAATTTLHGFQEPVENVLDFGTRVKAGAETFYAIVFDQEPTRISNVTIEEIGTDYVTVSWETNHPATGKVNYGDTLTFNKEAHLTKYETTHTAKLEGLTPGKKYFFEVMSHGKNYTYDSFYTVETIIEEKE